jgi:glycosyltransferase involved in cell wall biosynthesis
MRVIHSVGAKLAGGGLGNTAYHAVSAANRAGVLDKAIALGAAPTEIPKHKIVRIPYPLPLRALGRFIPEAVFYSLKDTYFDLMAARHVSECDVFHGWCNMMTRSVERARQKGALVVVNGSSSHPRTQLRLVRDEYRRYGHKEMVMTKRTLKRMSADLAEADRVLAASLFVEKSLIDNGVAEEKVRLIPFGVDVDKYEPSEKVRNGRFNVLFVGRVCLRKGIQYLLAAWKELALDDGVLSVVGNVSRDARGIVEEHRNTPNVRFLGLVRSLEENYRQASVFAFPSIEEGSALVTYEAMAAGLPVVISENAGSVARHGIDGFVIPIRDVAAIVNSIRRIYENREEGQKMGAAAREHMRDYSWERYGDRVVDAYRDIVGARTETGGGA